MAILLTGGTGKTAQHIARLSQDAKVPFLLASRKAMATSEMPAVKFDWLDQSTYKNPFQYKFPNEEKISAIYLVAAEVADPVTPMIAFIDFAAKKYGVKKFVLLAGASVEKGGPYTGKVWQLLDDENLEYSVLRPSWFMENLIEKHYLVTIRDEGKIYTACGDGKISFVAVTDIAAVAFHSLVDTKPHNDEYSILGPESLTYDDIAAKLSSGLGRNIVHVKLSEDEKAQMLLKTGLSEHHAKFLAYLEASSSTGRAKKTNNVVEEVTGRRPLTFDAWVQENKTAWQ